MTRSAAKRGGTWRGRSVKQAKEFAKTLGPELEIRFYRFDSKLSELKDSVAKAESPRAAKPASARRCRKPRNGRKIRLAADGQDW